MDSIQKGETIMFLKELIEEAKIKWHGSNTGTVEYSAYVFLEHYLKLLKIMKNEGFTKITRITYSIDLQSFLDDLGPEPKTLSWEELKTFYEKHPMTKEEVWQMLEMIKDQANKPNAAQRDEDNQ